MQTTVPPASQMHSLDGRDAQADAQALTLLHDRVVDSVKGYAKVVEKAEPAFRDTAERFRALHARHAEDLARLLGDLGIDSDSQGTMMGTVHQAVVTFRAFFDDIDEDVMDQMRSGEDWILKAFDDAIAEQESTAAEPKLRAMQAELTDLLAETRHLG